MQTTYNLLHQDMSFLPSVVRDWNNLPEQAKQLDSVNSFKSYLNRDRASIPKYYYVGSRKSQILYTRLRTNCSCLNHDLSLKNIVDSPLCRCGNIETTYHFFFFLSLLRTAEFRALHCHWTTSNSYPESSTFRRSLAFSRYQCSDI